MASRAKQQMKISKNISLIYNYTTQPDKFVFCQRDRLQIIKDQQGPATKLIKSLIKIAQRSLFESDGMKKQQETFILEKHKICTRRSIKNCNMFPLYIGVIRGYKPGSKDSY